MMLERTLVQLVSIHSFVYLHPNGEATLRSRDACIFREVLGNRLRITERLGVKRFPQMAQVQLITSQVQEALDGRLCECVGGYGVHPLQANNFFLELSGYHPTDAITRCQ